MPSDKSKFFTLVFEGDIRTFKKNPLTTETPFGIPFAAGVGDAFWDLDEARGENQTEPVRE